MLSTPRRSPRLRTAAGSLLACALLSACGPAVADDGAALAPTTTAAPAPAQDVDWKSLAYEAADCQSRQEWIDYGEVVRTWDDAKYDTVTGDVTGEGDIGTAVEAYCPTPTSTLSGWVAVFRHGEDGPELLGVLTDLFFQGPSVTLDEGTVTVEGPTRSGDDAMCCPGHWGRAVYEWDGDSFELVESEEVRGTQPESGDAPGVSQAAPTTPPAPRGDALADGSYAGIIRGIEGDTVLIDVIEWFEDDAATQACIEDGKTDAVEMAVAWCTDYYMRNNNDLVRTLPLAADATVTYIDWENSGNDIPRPVRTVLDRIVSTPEMPTQFAFTVEDGVVTEFPEEHFIS
jgi:hypothetical protein